MSYNLNYTGIEMKGRQCMNEGIYCFIITLAYSHINIAFVNEVIVKAYFEMLVTWIVCAFLVVLHWFILSAVISWDSAMYFSLLVAGFPCRRPGISTGVVDVGFVWTKWHWDRFASRPPVLSSHQYSTKVPLFVSDWYTPSWRRGTRSLSTPSPKPHFWT